MITVGRVEDNKTIRESLAQFVQDDPECRCFCTQSTREDARSGHRADGHAVTEHVWHRILCATEGKFALGPMRQTIRPKLTAKPQRQISPSTPIDRSPSMNVIEKREGFPGQRIVVLPRTVVGIAQRHDLIGGLLPTDVGVFPCAQSHLRERPEGAEQTIFIYCTRGAGWCELSGRNFSVKAGELLVVPAQVPHIYGADHVKPWTIHWVHAVGSLINPFLRELDVTINQPVVRIGEDPHLLALFEELLDVFEHGYTILQLLCASQTLGHLLALMIRDHRTGYAMQPTPQQKVAQTIDYMKQHLNQNLTLNALAGVANLSRSQYVALFKQQTGYPPIDYFIRLRMHRACQLLDTTGLSIKSVAAELGFEDALYFSRVFRLVNQKSPTDYRNVRKG
jgi:AraC family transcriptional regulator of arabinose operon